MVASEQDFPLLSRGLLLPKHGSGLAAKIWDEIFTEPVKESLEVFAVLDADIVLFTHSDYHRGNLFKIPVVTALLSK